jgi:hypothetical protein
LHTAAVSASAQSSKESKSKFGIKAGYNFSNVVGSGSSFDPKHNNGYMVSAFLAGAIKMASATEVNWCIQNRIQF